MASRRATAEPQRLFVAVDPPSYATGHLVDAVARLHVARAQARLAPPERWHVTVAFLGDVAAERVDQVKRVLPAAAGSCAPGQLRIAGGGQFGRGSGAVLWAGVAGDVARLRRLARTVGRELRRDRLPCDRKPYRPHLTLARPGDRVARELIREDVTVLAGYQGPEWTAAQVHLVRSFLGPDPRHVRLASYPIG